MQMAKRLSQISTSTQERGVRILAWLSSGAPVLEGGTIPPPGRGRRLCPGEVGSAVGSRRG
jgi:hypothetical protein